MDAELQSLIRRIEADPLDLTLLESLILMLHRSSDWSSLVPILEQQITIEHDPGITLLVQTLIQIVSNDWNQLFQTLVRILRLTCETKADPTIVENLVRDRLTIWASQTGVWHGIILLTPPTLNYYHQVLQNGFFTSPARDDNLEDWRDEQVEGLYTYYYPPDSMEEQTARSVWVNLDCKLSDDPRFGVVWLDNDDYLPDWEGIPIEEARISGAPGGILGSYRLTRDVEIGDVIDYFPTSIGPLPIPCAPEMQLHIISC